MFHTFSAEVSASATNGTFENPFLHKTESEAQPEPNPDVLEIMRCSMSAVHVSQADTEEKMAYVTLAEVL